MAEIPVEKKTGGGLPWWLIPLLLLLILLPLLWFTMRGCSPAPVANVNNNLNANRVITNVNENYNGTSVNNVNATNLAVSNTAAVVNNNTAIGNANAGNTNLSSNATVTDVIIFGNTKDKASMVGSKVDFANVRVNRVLSDRVFTVKSGNEEMFVLLDQAIDTAIDNKPGKQIKIGEMIGLKGDFRNVPTAEAKDERSRGLDQKEYAQMKGQQVYLHANSMTTDSMTTEK